VRLAWAEHGRASVDRQAELAIKRYAIALDWCHRMTDRKRARDEPPRALQHAHAREADVVPTDPSGRVGLFVCGPTVNDLPHLGHAKTYTQFDFLVRLPRARGFSVRYLQHITDVDDKIIRRARELGIDPSDVTRRYERAYLDDMRALRNDSVDVYARPSDYIDQVISGSTRASLPRPSLCAIAHAPVDLGARVAARVVDGLDVYAGHLQHAASA